MYELNPTDQAARAAVRASVEFSDYLRWLAAERRAVDRALERDVPVLGICFGSQHLARALGGTVAPASRPEVGWLDVETLVPDVVPPGPWLQWHGDAFTVPPGAELLARSPVCPQAFRLGPHLGVQFHPETTTQLMSKWVRMDPNLPDTVTPEQVDEQGALHGEAARENALRLFDAWWAGARNP
jgi:GMP synthase-like glutamine amidotransferase